MDWVWVLIPLTALSIPVAAIWTGHQRQMIELKAKLGQAGDGNVVKEIQELRQQIAEIRDTTTRYDMSFDSALQRIESRVGVVESRVNSIVQDSNGLSAKT